MNFQYAIRTQAFLLIWLALCAGCATHSIHVTHNEEKFEAGVNGRTMVTYQLKAH